MLYLKNMALRLIKQRRTGKPRDLPRHFRRPALVLLFGGKSPVDKIKSTWIMDLKSLNFQNILKIQTLAYIKNFKEFFSSFI